jgi:hypothetical protein
LKVLFLDVDGVLINLRCYGEGARGGEYTQAHPDCVAALNRVTDETGARIVVSSVWRLGGVKKIRDILRGWGVTGKVIGCTPDLARKPKESLIWRHVERGEEIQAWLDAHAERARVDAFCIVDDDADMKHLLPRLIQTDFADGFTETHAGRCIEMLAG